MTDLESGIDLATVRCFAEDLDGGWLQGADVSVLL